MPSLLATTNPQKHKLDHQEQKQADVALESPLLQQTKSGFRKATPLQPNESYIGTLQESHGCFWH